MKKELTIGLFVDTYYPMVDGVVMVVDNYARKLSTIMNVIVFCTKIKRFDDSMFPYKVVRCPSFKIPFLDYSFPIPNKKFKKEIEKFNLDIVHIHSPFTIGRVASLYAKKNNIPLVGTMHSQLKKDFKRSINITKT